MKFLKNTSRYNAEEVRALLQFAVKEIDLDVDTVAWNVKNNGKSAYAGRAYCGGIPTISPWSKVAGPKALIILRIGAPEKFPVDNMCSKWERKYITPWLVGSPFPEKPTTIKTTIGDLHVNAIYRFGVPSDVFWEYKKGTTNQFRLYQNVLVKYPYGGKSSTYIKNLDWRECLVSLGAHEAQHIYQYRTGRPLSEVECEAVASLALNRYRKAIGTRMLKDGDTVKAVGTFSLKKVLLAA